MKRIISLLTIVVILTISPSCENDIEIIRTKTVYNKEYKGIDLTRGERMLASKDLDFGLSIFKGIVNRNNLDEDVLISPLSSSMAFAMLSAGAKGQTRKEIVKGLGFNDFDYSQVAAYYKKVSDQILSASKDNKVAIANAIWCAGNVKQNYADEVRSTFNSEIKKIDISQPKATADMINSWTSDKTNGMIPSILPESIAASASIVLENVLYFNSSWQFDSHQRVLREFTDSDNITVNKDFFTSMSPRLLLSFFNDEVSVIKIPYKGGAFNMMVVLPKTERSFTDFIHSLSSQKWDYWSSSCDYNKVLYSVPCFESRSEMSGSFKAEIENRGIRIPFTPSADFSNMVDMQVFVTYLAHNTSIAVSEKGTEATAATAIVMSLTAPSPDLGNDYYVFNADRPFVYAIEEASTGILLFIGTHVK